MKPVALITGASQGMGRAIAEELSTRDYDLVLLARSEEVEVLAKHVNGIAVRGSIASEEDLKRMVSAAMDTYGRIDAVVTSTGHLPKGELLEITDENWYQALDLSTLAVARLARLVTPIMVEQGKGAWVNLSTFATFEPSPLFPLSSVMRAALAGYTKLYADEYAPAIRMNNLLPGFVENYPVDEAMLDVIPMRRQAKLKEIAETAAFLLSEGAGYITGQNIRVDGGITRSV